MWFNSNDLHIKKIIKVDDLHGYVLPHAGTAFTGDIISHTLRFRSEKKFTKVIILYYSASNAPDVDDTYFHEYYVPWKSMKYIFNNKQITYTGYNLNDLSKKPLPKINENTLIVVSADFSHFLPFSQAIELENKAAKSIMFKQLNTTNDYMKIVDDSKTFKLLYDIIPSNWMLQWIGRTRSSGVSNAVGYLSFLVREKPNPSNRLPDGIFVTVYAKNMIARECLGEWFTNKSWTMDIERALIDKVIYLGGTTSRLTDGADKEVPLTNYTITYLYRDKRNEFIRGWHGVLHNAFFLPDVFLENTFNNGHWITSTDKEWQRGNVFNLEETLNRLNIKSGILGAGIVGSNSRPKYTRNKVIYKKKIPLRIKKTIKIAGNCNAYKLYSSRVSHFSI